MTRSLRAWPGSGRRPPASPRGTVVVLLPAFSSSSTGSSAVDARQIMLTPELGAVLHSLQFLAR